MLRKNGYKNNTYTVPDFCDTIIFVRERIVLCSKHLIVFSFSLVLVTPGIFYFIVVDYIHRMVRKILSLLKGAFQFVIVLKIYSQLDDTFRQYWLYKQLDRYLVELVPVLER